MTKSEKMTTTFYACGVGFVRVKDIRIKNGLPTQVEKENQSHSQGLGVVHAL